MAIKELSKNNKENRRGTNAMPPYLVRRNAYKSVEKLKSRLGVLPVLDIGCGLGYFVQYCEESGIPCYGVDLDPRQLSYARTRMRKHGIIPKLYQEDARKLPFEDNYFGFVNCWGVLMMIPHAEEKISGRILSREETREEVKKALSEMRRVVRDNGEIRIITFSEREQSEPTYYKLKPEELEELGREVGLTPISLDYDKRWPNFVDANFKKV